MYMFFHRVGGFKSLLQILTLQCVSGVSFYTSVKPLFSVINQSSVLAIRLTIVSVSLSAIDLFTALCSARLV